MTYYNVFTRRWYKDNPEWPNGLEPDGNGRKHYLKKGVSEVEARKTAQEYNRTHNPGRYSLKAEFETCKS